MRRLIPIFAMLAAALWPASSLAQSRAQLGPLCTSEGTPADQKIDACNKIIALKVFSGEQLATVYFWRAVGWNKKGNYPQVIADTTEALRTGGADQLGIGLDARRRHADRVCDRARQGRA